MNNETIHLDSEQTAGNGTQRRARDGDERAWGIGWSGTKGVVMGLSPVMSDRIRRLSDVLQRSSLGFEQKEQLYEYIAAASGSANGAADKIQAMSETLLMTVLMLVEDRVRRETDRMELKQEVAKEHDEHCVFRTPAGGKLGFVLLLKWPIALVLIVAMVTQNIDTILNAFKEFL